MGTSEEIPAEKQRLLRLITGEIIQFAHEQEAGDYLRLRDCRIVFPSELVCSLFPSGMEVRQAHIVWQAQGGMFAGY